MKAFLSRLAQFFQDDTGQLSAMRLLFILWGVGVFGVWLFLSIKTAAMVAVPWSIISFISSLVAGKVVQSYTENSTSPTGTTTATVTNNPADATVTPPAVPTPAPAVPVAPTPISVAPAPAPAPAPVVVNPTPVVVNPVPVTVPPVPPAPGTPIP